MGVNVEGSEVSEVKAASHVTKPSSEFNWASIRPEWNSWDMLPKSDEGDYALVGGRRYSRHAIDNMMPSGFGQGVAMSDSGDKGLGISPRIVEETIRNGIKEASNDGDAQKLNYKLGNVLITVGVSDGRIISVGYRKSR